MNLNRIAIRLRPNCAITNMQHHDHASLVAERNALPMILHPLSIARSPEAIQLKDEGGG
jgi:hypothetical protein